jgi:hypothetical protein
MTRNGSVLVTVVTIGVALLVGGCGTSGIAASAAPPSVAATPTVSAPPPASPSPTAAAAAEPTPIQPGSVVEEAPLKRLWTTAGPVAAVGVGQPDLDRKGDIWVCSGAAAEFWIYDRNGKLVDRWGKGGKGDGEFDFRRDTDWFCDIGFAPDGSFYVSEVGNHRIQHFSADRKFLGKWGTFGTDDDQFVTPNQVSTDAAGNVYVHDDELGLIKEFRSDGTFVRSFGESSYPFFTVDGDGDVYAVSDQDKILREYTPDGTIVRALDLSKLVSFESGLGIDSDGHLWIGSNIDLPGYAAPDRLLEFDKDWKLLHDWKGMGIAGLSFDRRGDRIYASFYAPDVLAAYAPPA